MKNLLEGACFHHLHIPHGEPAATYAKQHNMDDAELFMKNFEYSQKKTGGGLNEEQEKQLLNELNNLEFKVKTNGTWVQGTDKDFKGWYWSSQE